MNSSLQILFSKIEDYKRKYYKNRLIKGLLYSLALVLTAFLVVNFIEYFGRLSSPLRGTLLFIFIGICIYTVVSFIGSPLLNLFKIKKGISDTEAAIDIGKFFPEISDKLLNTIQLASNSSKDNSLLLASIEQKSQNFALVKFADAINLGENKKYLKYALPPLALILLLSAVVPSFFKSSERIIKFRKDFAQEAPFAFEVLNDNLKAVKDEDFILNLRLKGEAFPEEVFLVYNDRKFKMSPVDGGDKYTFEFTKVQQPISFNFLAAGFNSDEFQIDLINKPELLNFDVQVVYPGYLGKPAEKLNNVGNLIVPEGTKVTWRFNTINTDSLSIKFDDSPPVVVDKSLVLGYNYSRRFKTNSSYSLQLSNSQMVNPEQLAYYVNVVNDQFPKIQLEQIQDTTNYNYIVLGGNLSDDYGFTEFNLRYRLNSEDAFTSIPISFNKSQVSQTFFYQFNLLELNLEQEDKLEYFLEIKDNDGVNGPKATKTSYLTFALPNNQQFDAEVEKQTKDAEKKLTDLVEKSKDLQKDIEELDKKLKSKKKIEYQEKKELEDLLKKKEELRDELKQLQKEFDKLQEKQNRFQEQSPELQEKMDQLQQLMNELMKDEEIYEQMKELLEQNDEDKIMDQLEKMKQNDRNLDKDIDRTLKLFKNLQLKQKLEKVATELENLADKQDELADKTEKASEEELKELQKEQEKIEEEFENQKEELEKSEELAKELKKNIDTQKEKQEEVSEDMEDAQQQMEQQNKDGASKSQKKAGKSMRNMSQALNQMMQTAEMEQLDLDMDALRDILENLIKLSFDQENLLKTLRTIDLSDPRYVEVSQEQLKLTDDAKVIEDSLYSLATRVMQIQSFITKEVTEMKNNMDESIQLLRDRDIKLANAKQQFSMTSINNLALMLGDTFQQMQEMMASAMPGSGKGGKKGQMPMPGIGEQQQKLNQRIQQLGEGGSGQNGKQLSQELAKIASEQAKLRKKLEQMKEQLNGTELGKKIGDELSELQKQMDQNENDLINKRVTPQLKNRSKKLETRLLEVEKAVKEQELDPKRKSKTGGEFERTSPPALEEFLKEKQKQLELIRTTPPNFTPYYKKETDSYFQRIK